MVNVKILPDKTHASEEVAQILHDLIVEKPNAVIGVATGSTPEGAYERLAEKIKEHNTDVSQLRFFALDEYVGISWDHPESYHAVINRTVTVPLGVDPSQVNVPEAPDDAPVGSVESYDEKIAAAGGIDLQLLGIGRNGHIGFNEPGTPFDAPTHVGELTNITREDNSRFFEGGVDEVPPTAITQGIGTILKSRQAILMAFGEAKADAIRDSLATPPAEDRPGSSLQHHSNCVLYLDEAAAAKIED
ncbi:glucosamine-6-phosphate deaminase [Yaniella flava]|uniref:Glucosamine-6-phosphate deaminase n=1 Tax=Yaniella flava TaxID=287930 RepID=A0ABN2UV53_9MICC|nr:glucosamine-6-phosphate deaminase [Micrococcaceae bacterium]